MRKCRLASILAATLVATAAEAATFTVINTNTSGAGSLAQAITNANATAAADVIEFNIVGVGIHTIAGSLPAITQPLTIDGYTQPGAQPNNATDGTTNADLRIVLDGSDLDLGDSVLDVEAGPTTIRGLTINGISDTKSAAINVASGVTDVSILGNFIGTNAKADADASSGHGIIVRGSAQIGTEAAPDLNVISGNDGAGVMLRGAGAVVQGNLIGVNLAGLPNLGNGVGVQLLSAGASDNLIGGSDFQGNTIAGNELEGIRVNPEAGSGNSFFRNRIFANGALGIDLKADGPTLNDEGDGDSGPNGLINAPELHFARLNNAKVTIHGAVRGIPGAGYVLNTYLSEEPDPSGFGEGQMVGGGFAVNVPLGETAGNFEVAFNLGDSPTEALYVTATLTREDSTSEFSRAVEAVQAGDEIVVTNTNDSGAGSLRAALAEANASTDPNTIVFEIPGDGPHTIVVGSFLGVNEDRPVLIDGYSQAGAEPNTLVEGSNAIPGIVLDGTAVSTPGVLDVERTSLIVRGLAIHSSQDSAIRLIECEGAVIEGCFLGVGADGTTALGNAKDGLRNGFSTDTRVGGPNVGQRNILSGNGSSGISDAGSGTEIVNNLIGVGANGATAVPNGQHGIDTRAQSAVIGGDEPALQNVIAGNGFSGIAVGDAGSGIEIRGNSVVANEALGIDLAEGFTVDVVTQNDADDGDDGGNALQNFPEILGVTAGAGTTTISGLLDVPADRVGTTYTLRAFASAECDGAGHGEGERFLGARDAVIPESEEFSVQFPVTVADGEAVTMTATDPTTGNTSEFSACLVVGAPVCGDANGDDEVKSGDALIALNTAVGSDSCAPCACDINESGAVNTTDALLILKKAVGQPVVLECPPCDE